MRTVQDGSAYKVSGEYEPADREPDIRPSEAGGNSAPQHSKAAPCANPERWVPHRKAEVVDAVRGGVISLDEACRRYALSLEEFLAWQYRIDRFGLAGLRVYGRPARDRAGDGSDTKGIEPGPRRKARRRPAKSKN